MEEYAGEADNLLTIDPVGVGSDEMFIGRAGYLSGCLWLQRKLGRQVILTLGLFRIVESIDFESEDIKKFLSLTIFPSEQKWL